MADFNHDRLIQEFCDLTGASPADAQQFLAANRWNLSSAATEYYTSQEENVEEAQEEEPYTGPRTLDGRPAPQSAVPATASSSSSRNVPRRGIATLGSYNQGDSGHGGHDDDDDDDSDLEDDPRNQPRDLFAGGEKSGLAVQDPPRRNDPRSLVDDILKKARANTPRQGGPEAPAATPSRFRGSGQTLGGDGAPSQVIPSATPSVPDPGPTQTRVLHLWEDGFSVEDGPLHRFDDPRNAADLQMIRQGRAPLHLMNVRPDQPVDVQLNKHDENYRPPPKVYKPFSGQGHRLGSPTPGPGSSTAPPPTTAAPSQASGSPTVSVDASQPVISIRLQLGNGTRLPVRFNTTHTIGDVYDFISRAYPGSNNRPWVLATTFPNKDHTDRSLVLGEVPEFKRGGTAVQKWA